MRKLPHVLVCVPYNQRRSLTSHSALQQPAKLKVKAPTLLLMATLTPSSTPRTAHHATSSTPLPGPVTEMVHSTTRIRALVPALVSARVPFR